jgi:site-specific recombinase XerD
MLEKSFGLLFFLKQPKNQNTEGKYVYLRITVDGVPKEISTKRIWYTDKWNQAYGRAIGNKDEAKSLNAFLDALTVKIHQAKTSLIESNKSVTAESIKNIISGNGDERKMLLKIFEDYNKQVEALVGKDYSPLTLKRFKTTCSHTATFIKTDYSIHIKRAILDIDIRELDYDFIEKYIFWLKTKRNCAHNSVMKYISTLKQVIKPCLLKKWISEDPFDGFKTAPKEVEIIPLDNKDLQAIANKKIDIERLAIVRDIFLFSCYTGLAYVDVNNLKRDQILEGIDGEQWIITKRQKTKTPTRVPLLAPALEISERYKDHPKCHQRNSVLPVLTNQKMNSYLKEIADTCGIDKNLTFHIARHTFATTVTLTNGVPLETVSKMLGHKNLKQTQHYAKIVDSKISEDMMLLKNRLFPVAS